MDSFPHYPVLLAEVIQAFESVTLSVVIDGTLGAGGHAEALLQNHPEIEHFLGIDQDPQALVLAAQRLKPWASKIALKHGNFAQFDDFLRELSFPKPNGILLDLGVSSMQLDQPSRGFSFMQEGPLDMRMNPKLSLTAAHIVNTWSEQELGQIFRDFGEEKQWRAAARAIVKARQTQPFMTTSDLTTILSPVLKRYAKKGIHPVTLIFQALRIVVNQELEVLESFLPKALDFLAPKGRLAVISFHSLEDRLVKKHLRFAASDKLDTSGLSGLFQDKEPIVKILTKKPIEAGLEEIHKNPRSRSAKLRVAEKL
jgi:16S rRNA (cytosine1402-N4)-methyltransferase